MYEYDAPLAERRAAALSLDRDLLRDLLGGDELRDLLDPEVLAELEAWLQRTVERRRARDADELHDALRELGPLSLDDAVARAAADTGTVQEWLAELVEANRAIAVRVADRDVWAAAQDAARLRDALGVALPPGLPAVFTEPVDDPIAELVSRYARTHGPFTLAEASRALGAPSPRVNAALQHLVTTGRVLEGAFRPAGSGTEFVDQDVLRRLRRRSLAALRAEVEAVEPTALARFLPAWHDVRTSRADPRRRGLDGLAEVLAQLQGFPLPASVLEEDVLADRVRDYSAALLDELVAAGEVVWFGAEPLGSSDGRIVLCFRDQVHLLAPEQGEPPSSQVHAALRAHLGEAGASFWPELFSASGLADQEQVLQALWDLVWAGEVTNDTLAPLRGLLASGTAGRARRRSGRPGALRRAGPPAARGRWSLTEDLRGAARDTAIGTARAGQLLERWGVVTADAVRGEGHRGGFAGVYEVFKAMEETGQVRRGYFVEGLGGAQFAPAGAVDRLRDHREPPRDGPVVVRLAATDPAQPYGAALSWPDTAGRPARQAGAHVVLVDGECALYVERGGRSLATMPTTLATAEHWGPALTGLVSSGRLAKLEITRVDGGDVFDHPLAEVLEGLGMTAGYRGYVLRR